MLNSNELKTLRDIESKYYMQPMLEAIKQGMQEQRYTLDELFNHLYNYLLDCKDLVENLIQERVINKEIKDASQARKSIAGSAFSYLIIWVFLKNKEQGKIKQNIFITSKISSVPKWQDLFFIKVGEETQKPDVDLVIYSLDTHKNLHKCLIYR